MNLAEVTETGLTVLVMVGFLTATWTDLRDSEKKKFRGPAMTCTTPGMLSIIYLRGYKLENGVRK